MSTLTQVLLVIVITVLTITLTIIGIQIFLILKEVRERISKLDPILDNVAIEQEYLNEILLTAKDTTQRLSTTTQYLSEEVIEPVGNILSAVKGISQLVGQFRPQKKSRKSYLADNPREEYDE